jgi:hypothetical protein
MPAQSQPQKKNTRAELLHRLAGICVYIWIKTNLTLFRCCIVYYVLFYNNFEQREIPIHVERRGLLWIENIAKKSGFFYSGLIEIKREDLYS